MTNCKRFVSHRPLALASVIVMVIGLLAMGVAGSRQLGRIGLAAVTATNVALQAAATASSQDIATGQAAAKAIDGSTLGYPTDGTHEWATLHGKAGSWLNLAWSTPQTVDSVVLFDRPNRDDRVMAGTLVFSDGSTVAVGALDNAGNAVTVSFPSRATTSIRFNITRVSSKTYNVGLAEMQVMATPAVSPSPTSSSTPTTTTTTDVALQSAATASSEDVSTGQTANKAIDASTLGYPTDGTHEWATVHGKAGSWLNLAWSTPQTVDSVVLFDRPNIDDQVTSGRLSFSDGSTVSVGALDNAGAGVKVSFPSRSITSLRFDITGVSATTYNVGLAEIQVMGQAATGSVPSPSPSPTTSSPSPSASPTNASPSPTSSAGPVATVGPAGAPAAAGVAVPAGADIQSYINANLENTTFVLAPGVYRLAATIFPKAGDTIAGSQGTVLSGAISLTGFVSTASYWYLDGVTAQVGWGDAGFTQSGWEGSAHPEDLFVDDVVQKRVNSVSAVVPGTWFYDTGAHRVYVGTNPAGHRVEMSHIGTAFGGSTANVTLQGLVIEKVAAPAQYGAVNLYDSSNWTVQFNEIRYNHGAGVFAGSGAVIRNNVIHDNGQLGVKAYTATGAKITNNQISNNNVLHFEPFWEAGGIKLVNCKDTLVANNAIIGNHGFGVWSDYSGTGTVYDSNVIDSNDFAGIQHEASFQAVISNNLITNNGVAARGVAGAHTGGGIYIYDGRDVEVVGNTIAGNVGGVIALGQNRGTAGESLQPAGATLEVRNLWVHGNDISMTRGFNGLFINPTADYSPYPVSPAAWGQSYFTSMNIRWDYNTYRGSGYTEGAWTDSSLRFLWGDPMGYPNDVWAWGTRRYMGPAAWRSYGQDTHSTFLGTT